MIYYYYSINLGRHGYTIIFHFFLHDYINIVYCTNCTYCKL